MMLEKVLWHGFKAPGQKALIVLKTPDAELWLAISKLARSSEAMRETITCVEQLEHLITPIARLRAFLRLAMMQKKLADFFTHITQSVLLKDFYEPWSLVRQEDVVQLCGALLGLSVVDCNLTLDHDHLREQPLSVDLSLYIRLPTVSIDPETGEKKNEHQSALANERKMLLDQNNYLEERNRQLESNVSNMNKRLESIDSDRSSLVFMEQDSVSYRNIDEPFSPLPTPSQRDSEWEEEKNRLLGQVVEREDSLRIVQQQLLDTKKINVDLYDKLRLAEESVRKVEKDFVLIKEHHMTERENMHRTIRNLEDLAASLTEQRDNRDASDETVRTELIRKCDQYTQVLAELEHKQDEVSKSTNEVSDLRKQVAILQKEVNELPFITEELNDLRVKFKSASERADESEKALEELGGHLSVSKLRMVELEEELLPLSEAHWALDSEVHQCSTCEEKFTLAKRKHHCRMCGSIFCSVCSEGRVKLPSNPKPARVCDKCFSVLKSRQIASH